MSSITGHFNQAIECNYHNSGHYPSSCILFKTQLNSTCLSVPHRKHITSPLRDQQVNAIYKFVTMVYYYNYHNSGYYPLSFHLFKTRRFGDWILSLSLSLGGNCSVGSIHRATHRLCTKTSSLYWANWFGSTWTRRQNPASESSCFK
jgi:hypothetical protein